MIMNEVTNNQTGFEWLKSLNEYVCGFMSTERQDPIQKVSNSELKRWLEKGSVVLQTFEGEKHTLRMNDSMNLIHFDFIKIHKKITI